MMKRFSRTLTLALSAAALLFGGSELGQQRQAIGAGWVDLGSPTLFCSGSTAAVQLSWTSPRLTTEHWVDLSLQDNGFAGDSYLSAGPFGIGATYHAWSGLQTSTVHYYRVTARTPDGWIASETGTFRTCDAPAVKTLPPLEASPDFAITREMEIDLFRRHNDVRDMAGVGSLQLDDTLTRVARERARDMASRGYVSHFSPTGQTAFSMLYEAGYVYIHGAENIGQNDYPLTRTVGAVMMGFLDSPPHHETIINPRFTHAGVAVALTRDDWKYFVVVFAQR